jgi:hemerythrin-like domain-containing protein
MPPTDVLTEEHIIVRPFLDALEVAARRLEAHEPVRVGLFTDAIDFINGFVDGCHHRKEEGALFPAMEAAGVPQLGGLMGEILAEHDEGRRLTIEIRAYTDKLGHGDQRAALALALAVLSYVRMVRAHIAKEDRALFPMANKTLSASQQAHLADEFERVEREEVGDGSRRRFVTMARLLEAEARGIDV